MQAKLRRVAVILFLLNVCGAWYIDPGATSLLWQLIVSGVVGVGFTLRHSIRSLVNKFRRRGHDER